MELDKPIVLDDLSEEEFNVLMERAYTQYKNGECLSLEEVAKELKEMYNIEID